MLVDHTHGGYRFLAGIDAYSCGVVGAVGHEIVRVLLGRPQPWQQGFALAEAHLQRAGCPRAALCAVELRSPAPFSMPQFIAYNCRYCELLRAWGVYVGNLNPVARTNVAPVDEPPGEVVMHAFSYVLPTSDTGRDTFVVAGAGELRDGILEEERIVLRGQVDATAMRTKAAYVMDVMQERLGGLGVGWDGVTAVDVYTAHLQEGLLEAAVLPRLGGARRHGIRWHRTRPPVVDIEFEMDVRGVRREVVAA